MNEREKVTEAGAIAAMRERGVKHPKSLLKFAPLARILEACEWFDRRRAAGSASSIGLLVWAIKNPDEELEEDELELGSEPVATSVHDRMRALFDRYAVAYPVGSVTESHRALTDRQWPKDRDRCDGDMIVMAAEYPLLETCCDECGFEIWYPVRGPKAKAGKPLRPGFSPPPPGLGLELLPLPEEPREVKERALVSEHWKVPSMFPPFRDAAEHSPELVEHFLDLMYFAADPFTPETGEIWAHGRLVRCYRDLTGITGDIYADEGFFQAQKWAAALTKTRRPGYRPPSKVQDRYGDFRRFNAERAIKQLRDET